jgi:hypothetical protein
MPEIISQNEIFICWAEATLVAEGINAVRLNARLTPVAGSCLDFVWSLPTPIGSARAMLKIDDLKQKP